MKIGSMVELLSKPEMKALPFFRGSRLSAFFAEGREAGP